MEQVVGWSRVDTGRFSVALPPGWRYEALQGVDSFVGRFVGDDLAVHFDLGWYWNSVPADRAAHDLRPERVDGRSATLYIPRDPSEVLALYVEPVDDMDRRLPIHLSLVGRDVPLDRQALVIQVMRSVVFPRRLASGGRWEEVAPFRQNAAGAWSCNCRFGQHGGRLCSHVRAADLWLRRWQSSQARGAA